MKDRKTIKKHFKRTYKSNRYISPNNITEARGLQYLHEELVKFCNISDPYLAINKNIHWSERVFWLFSYLVLFITIILLLSPLCERLKKTPTVISVEMDYMNWNVSYPAVTLCPNNQALDEKTFNDINVQYFKKTGRNLSVYLNAISRINLYNMKSMLSYVNDSELKLIHPKQYALIAASSLKKFPILSLTTNNNWPISVAEVMTEMGMCHVINSNVAQFDNPLNWGKYMKYNKSSLQITIHEKDFFTQVIGYGEVYQIYVHSPNELPQSRVTSYSHDEPGLLAIGVKVWSTTISEEMKAKPINVRECRLINEPLNKRYPIYTYSHCLTECRIKLSEKLCNCVPHFYKSIDGEKTCNINELYCILEYKTEIQHLSVSYDLMKRLNRTDLPLSKKDCHCMTDCENDIYLKDYDSFMSDTSTYSLRVGLSSFPRLRVVKELLFGIIDVLLRIAGIINLWTGASVITLTDFVLNIVKVLSRCLYRLP